MPEYYGSYMTREPILAMVLELYILGTGTHIYIHTFTNTHTLNK